MEKLNWHAIRNTILAFWIIISVVFMVSSFETRYYKEIPLVIILWLATTAFGVYVWDNALKIYTFLKNYLENIYLKK
ncbi:MAG: hypothetical protein EOM50_14025 [Erysipelotrichia bacterium]|nr:hypothetical protein [Erysipelotrichia bacterium]